MGYAEGTEVSVDRSHAELGRLLTKHGATQRLMGADDAHGIAFCFFTIAERQVQLRVPIPTLKDMEPKSGKTPPGWWRKGDAYRAEWCRRRVDQVARERWRALVLLVKAKLELVALGISTVEREFLADIALPDGRTVHEAMRELLQRAYETGDMPPLLGPERGAVAE